MVLPYNDREAWAHERAEIPEQIAAFQRELAATAAEDTPRRERLTWQIRRAEKRTAELDARLAQDDAAPSCARPCPRSCTPR